MKIDKTKNALENLYLLVKNSNPSVTLVSSKVDVGVPVADTSGVDNNSRILVTAIKNKGFSGSKTLHYRRSLITELGTMLPSALEQLEGETVTQLKARILSGMGLLSTEVVINGGTDFTMPAAAATLSVPLTAKADSLVLAPGTTFNCVITGFIPTFTFAITGGSNVNAYTQAVAAGYANQPRVICNVTGSCTAPNTSTYALTTGAFPANTDLTVNISASIIGYNGGGGAGGNKAVGGAGGAGGPAMYVTTISGKSPKIEIKTGGGLYGGGGGGGGGGAGSVTQNTSQQQTTTYYVGGNAGRGAGTLGANTGGAGGGTNAGTGGTGGTYGAAGGSGSSGNYTGGGGGGAGGAAIVNSVAAGAVKVNFVAGTTTFGTVA